LDYSKKIGLKDHLLPNGDKQSRKQLQSSCQKKLIKHRLIDK